MRKDTLNYLVDVLALLALLGMVATGLVCKYVLPPASRGGRGLSLWGMDRHEWGDLHFWLAVASAALLTLHVILHWTWVCVMTRRLARPGTEASPVPRPAVRDAWGGGFFVVLVAAVGGFVWLANANVLSSPRGQGDGGAQGGRAGFGARAGEGRADHAADAMRGGGRGADFRGSSTLREVADIAGVSVQEPALILGLPEDADPAARIGPLARDAGLDMEFVRQRVAALIESQRTDP